MRYILNWLRRWAGTAMCLMLLGFSANAQDVVRGTVTDSAGSPIPVVTIKVKNSKEATTANNNGEFRVKVSPNGILEISSIGYESREVPVNNRSVVNVVLNTRSSILQDVVVTALGVRRDKRNLTYSTQQLSGSEITKADQPNIVNAVAGKIAGVQVISSSGTAGASSRIVIRGNSSATGNNQPLFVIDGIPVNNDETGNADGNAAGAGVNRAIDIDPSTIESMNVLKGAAATALYGSSGANGVVLITTKSGIINKAPVFSLSSSLSFGKPLLPERVTAFAQGDNGVFADGDLVKTSSSWGPRMDTLKINGKPAPRYNPYDFFRTGITSNSDISVMGGSANSSYFVSYSFYDDKGVMPGNDFKRHSFFAKYHTRMGNYVNTTFQLGYSNSAQNRLPEGWANGPLFVLFSQPVSWNPYPVLDANGQMRAYRFSRNMPLWTLDNMKNHDGVNRFIPVMTINITPAKWLTITERFGADIYVDQDNYFENPQPAIGLAGKVVNTNTNFRQFNNDFIVSANKKVNNFDLNLLLGNNIFSTYTQGINLTGNGLTIEDFYNLSAGNSISSSEFHTLQRKVGFYAQANVGYDRFLNLSLTGRYDGSSVLSRENNFYPYGSAAASFIFSELLSDKLRNTISFAKLRFSAATVGNDGVGPYSLATPFVQAGRGTAYGYFLYPFQGQPGFLLSGTLSNPNLKNERLNEYEGGLEFKLFGDRVSFEGSYFYRKSVDGIIPGVSISNATGFNGTTVNTASIQNKGLELLLGATPITVGDFKWNLTLNFTKIKSKVLALYPGIDQLGRLIVGQPYNIFYGPRYKRNSKGELLIDDNGIPLVDDEQGVVGDANPDWLAGLENNFVYKQFSLSVFFDVKMHGDVQNGVDSYGLFYGTAMATRDHNPFIVKGVRESDGKPNNVPISNPQAYWASRQYESQIQDGTYLKLRNVTLSYNFKKSTLAKTPFKSAALTLTGTNLWIYSPHFTGADPEVSSWGTGNGDQNVYAFSTPTARTFFIGVKLSF